jgi:hypothetical protein
MKSSKNFPPPTLPDVAKVTHTATTTTAVVAVKESDLDRNGKYRIKDGKDRHGQHGKNGHGQGRQGASLVIHGFHHGRPAWREIAESHFAALPSDKQPTKPELKEAFAKAIADGTPERARRLRKIQARLQHFNARLAQHTTDPSPCAHSPTTSLPRNDSGLIKGQRQSQPFDDTDAILATLDVMLDTGRGRGRPGVERHDYYTDADLEKLPLTAKIDAAHHHADRLALLTNGPGQTASEIAHAVNAADKVLRGNLIADAMAKELGLTNQGEVHQITDAMGRVLTEAVPPITLPPDNAADKVLNETPSTPKG